MEPDKDFKLDDECIYVSIFRGSRSLIIEMITDDTEALDLTECALSDWFIDKGLSFTTAFRRKIV